MRACGICNFIDDMTDATKKSQLIDILKPGSVSAEKAANEVTKFGLNIGVSSIRIHRRENNEIKKEIPKKEIKTPPGWEPFAEFTESIGSAIVRLPKPNATQRDLLISGGFDPAEWQIAGPINTRRWMRYDQQWLYYYKFDVVAGESPEVVEQHVDELVSIIRKPQKAPAFIKPGTDGFGYMASDWQIGKCEGQDGTPQTITRVMNSIDMAGERIKDLRKLGHKIPKFLFAGLGDLGEGTCGFYPGQQFLIDRNRRDQGRINRELITAALDYLTPMFDETLVAAVGGNHGENRSPEGKRLTSDGDNDDCAYFDAVREAFDRSGNHNITWDIMEDELSMAVNIGGVDVGLTHGHLFGSGNTAQKKALEWWKGQDFGFNAVRGTRIMISAHFHHFSCVCYGCRTHFQTPANDPGSKWVREAWGDSTPAGVLTMRFDSSTALGWDDVKILHSGRV